MQGLAETAVWRDVSRELLCACEVGEQMDCGQSVYMQVFVCRFLYAGFCMHLFGLHEACWYASVSETALE